MTVLFDTASLPEGDEQSSSGGVLGELFSSFSAPKAAPSGHSPKPSGDKREAEVAEAADAWTEVTRNLFVFGAILIVGRDLRPEDAEAEAIMRPLVKILMRHYDPARQASNDMIDAMTALVAVTLYLQRIGPAYRSQKAEQKVVAFRGSGPKVVPIDRGQQQAPQQARPAGVAAAATPGGSAGYAADALRGSLRPGAGPAATPGGASNGHGLTGEGALEEIIGGPLI